VLIPTTFSSTYRATDDNDNDGGDDDDTYCFNTMKTIFDQAMPKLKNQHPKNIDLFKLMYSDNELNPSDCIDAPKDIEVRWSHAHDAIGDTSILYHVITTFRALEVDIPHSRLPDLLFLCSETVKEAFKTSPEPNYAMIGKSSIKKIEKTAGNISDIRDENFSGVMVYNDMAGVLERLVEDFERAITALQDAQSATGVPVAGPTLELLNESDVEDGSARLCATAIHKFALRQLAGRFRSSLAAAKKDAEDKEAAAAAAAQVQENDEDEDIEM
jgi:hypothetical protein